MQNESKKAILVVSFGTSFPETREKNIDAIEAEIKKSFPEYSHYRAWTSKMIMAKLLKRDNIKIRNVSEAMEQMYEDGVTDVVIQPTHVINGIENDLMKEDALKYQDRFHSITFGNPLLTTEEDNHRVVHAVASQFASELDSQTALVLMGHGTTHFANSIYAALNFKFQDEGYSNIFLGTVEAYPTMDSLLKAVQKTNARKVLLAPFMIVAGDHATNDMAGNDEESWKVQFEQAGFSVECILKGLGEYPEIRTLFNDHVRDAIASAQ
ncbi:MAG: sirohydrochlorin cobaltochelatase [Ruminococcus sp.]